MEARERCLTGEVEEADLINIETEEENEYIGSMIPDAEDYWIGETTLRES